MKHHWFRRCFCVRCTVGRFAKAQRKIQKALYR